MTRLSGASFGGPHAGSVAAPCAPGSARSKAPNHSQVLTHEARNGRRHRPAWAATRRLLSPPSLDPFPFARRALHLLRESAGLSLVETTLAVGILGLSLVAVL